MDSISGDWVIDHEYFLIPVLFHQVYDIYV